MKIYSHILLTVVKLLKNICITYSVNYGYAYYWFHYMPKYFWQVERDFQRTKNKFSSSRRIKQRNFQSGRDKCGKWANGVRRGALFWGMLLRAMFVLKDGFIMSMRQWNVVNRSIAYYTRVEWILKRKTNAEAPRWADEDSCHLVFIGQCTKFSRTQPWAALPLIPPIT